MEIKITENPVKLGEDASKQAIGIMKSALSKQDEISIILATGTSQFETILGLTNSDLNWSKINVFHLDEYLGISDQHPASFRKYLQERFVNNVNNLKSFHAISGDADDPPFECERLSQLIEKGEITLAMVGIGENGHLAFNDPPADFNTKKSYMVVELDEKCRRQQMGEGWFSTLDEVPGKAITMSIDRIMQSQNIICSVPDERKSEAVKNCLKGAITPENPASILQQHENCWIYLDQGSAKLI